ncbi:chromate transporter [Clostridium sp.]|uniref:chromate transporter n=1 Tax=Clostridium sp. TaxID=1506 RepID=UPI003463D76E
MNKIITMFFSFFKIGAFTFGGGYAMIPLIEKEVVASRKWISQEEFSDIITLSQSFPGALAVNASIFIGYKIGGFLGAVFALLGSILPSFFIIVLVAKFFMDFRNNLWIDRGFKGITAAVPILVLIAVKSLSKSVDRNIINGVILILTVVLISVFDVHPLVIIIASALYGAIFLRKKVK